jgi:DNA invertase Pin-like site-specific DNA recombinase
MLIGYARVSTEDQNLNRQIDALLDAGIDRRNIYKEKVTGTKKDRPMLTKMIDELQEGDTVIITELTRLSRSVNGHLRILIFGHENSPCELK